MANISFGATCTEESNFKELGGFARRVEELGFDSLWTIDINYSDAPTLECFSALAFMAAHTTRVLLGTSVMVLPLRNPLLVARTVTTLDIVSGGRAILGVGVGAGRERNFEAFGGSIHDRGRQCDEELEILRRVWTESSVSYEGRFYNFEEFTLLPRPIQKPHPPIWIGGQAELVLRRVGRWADGFIPVFLTPETAAPIFDRVNEYAQEYGREPSSVTKALHIYACLADTPEEGARITSEVLSKRYHRDASRSADRSVLFGTPDECRKLIEEFIEVGVTHFVIDPTCYPDQILTQLEVVSREILPYFRSA